MLSGETASALQFFRKAIDNDRASGHAWGNLGTLYRRAGKTVVK